MRSTVTQRPSRALACDRLARSRPRRGRRRTSGSPGARAAPPASDGAVDGPVELAERVGEALGVAGRQRGGGARDRDISVGSRSSSSFGRSRWPIHSSSGALGVSRRASPRAPSISQRAGVAPPRADLGDRHHARARRPRGAAASRRGPRSPSRAATVSPARGRRRTSRPGRPALAHGDDRGEVGHHRLDAAAGDELQQVDPVRADVADRAQLAALGRVQAPVPVGVEQQPVLQVAAGDEVHRRRARPRRRARAPPGTAGRSGC